MQDIFLPGGKTFGDFCHAEKREGGIGNAAENNRQCDDAAGVFLGKSEVDGFQSRNVKTNISLGGKQYNSNKAKHGLIFWRVKAGEYVNRANLTQSGCSDGDNTHT